jgi:hypothetical protein
MTDPQHETDVHDLTLSVIHALKMLDVSALSYVHLRRLYAALVATTNTVDEEIAKRSDADNLGETVRIQSPRKSPDEASED